MEKTTKLVIQSIHRQYDADDFQAVLDGWLEKGGEIISSGVVMHGNIPAAWAFILSPAESSELVKDETATWDWLEEEARMRAYAEPTPYGAGSWHAAVQLIVEARSRAGR